MKQDWFARLYETELKTITKKIKELHDEGQIEALKIHSRILKIDESDYPYLFDSLKLFDPKVPIIYDGFYYGSDIEYRPRLEKLIELTRMYPKLPIIVAHSGGYEILKYFLHLMKIENIYYDLSLSLQYFHDSSLYLDFKKLIKFSNRNKIMFGSDFIDGNPRNQFEILQTMFDELSLPLGDRLNINYNNAYNLFKAKKYGF